MDAHKNFAYSTVATAPSPAASGTSMTLAAGGGALQPATPFNATVWPTGVLPLASNAEVVRVTNIAGDVLTIARAQESSSARTIIVGDQFAATITAKTLTDVEAAVDVVSAALSVETSVRVAKDDLLSQAISVISTAASNALSVAILAGTLGAAETSNRVSADNALSQAVSVVSQALSVETAARVAADNSLSQSISVLSQQVSALSQQASLFSQLRSVLKGGATSTYLVKTGAGDFAFTWASVAAGGVGSVTSAQRDVLSQGISVLSQQVSALSQSHSALSQVVSLLSQGLSNEISNRTSADNVVSAQAASALSQALSVLSVNDAALSSRITSVLSTDISNLRSAVSTLSTNISIASAAATSADAHAAAASAAATSVAAVASLAASALATSVNTASAAATSADAHAAAASAAATSVAAVASLALSILSQGLSNEISNRTSADNVVSAQAASVASVVSAAVTSVDARVSNALSAISVLSQQVSVLSQALSVISAGLGLPQMRVASNAQVISAASFTNVSGLSLSVTSAATYRIEGRVLFTTSLATGTAFGFTYPALTGPGVMTMEFLAANAGTPANLTSANYVANRLNETSMSTVATAQLSLVAQLVSATTGELEIYGLVHISTTAGTIQLQAKQSATGGGVQILAGSYLQAFRVL